MADDLAPPDGPSRQELEAVLRQLAGPATADGPTRSAASHRPPANPAPPDPGRPAEPVTPDRFLTAETLRGLLEAIPDALVII